MTIEPFPIAVARQQIDDLHRRLRDVRWQEKETVDDWSQGVPLAFMRRACDHWLHRYDWRRCEAQINALGSFATRIDGLRFHFLHVRSRHEDAKPLILTHGWPGSILEFVKAIPLLTDPTAHGGAPSDAFHVVVPALPGYGFSERPDTRGWDAAHIAAAWNALMGRLGYDRYLAQGGDWGAPISLLLGRLAPDRCKAVHVNLVIAGPDEAQMHDMTPDEEIAWARINEFQATGTGYSKQQSTRPQTLGYGLVDSPVAQAAWILEKFGAWCEAKGDPEQVLSLDEMLDGVMMYWLTGTGGSSGRLYWESFQPTLGQVFPDPVGATIFPGESMQPSRRWAENKLKNIIYWSRAAKGGHFAALEQPELFTQELRACFGPIAF